MACCLECRTRWDRKADWPLHDYDDDKDGEDGDDDSDDDDDHDDDDDDDDYDDDDDDDEEGGMQVEMESEGRPWPSESPTIGLNVWTGKLFGSVWFGIVWYGATAVHTHVGDELVKVG